MSKWTRVGMCLLAIACCGSKPIARGYVFTMQPVPPFPPGPPVCKVDIVDTRLPWEHRYYQGAVDPQFYKQAITFVPLENFSPSVLSELKNHIDQQLRKTKNPPIFVAIQLRAFRVVLSDVEKLREKWEQSRKNRVQEELENIEEFQDAFGVLAFEGVVYAAQGAVYALKAGTQQIRWLTEKERHYVGRPKELKEPYEPGATCAILANATIHWKDGRKKEIPILVRTSHGSLPDSNPREYRGEDVRDIVRQALVDVALKIADPAR